MKKTYINPNIEVVKIASQMQMLAGSNFSKSGDFGGESGGTSGKTITVDGRSFDFFDED